MSTVPLTTDENERMATHAYAQGWEAYCRGHAIEWNPYPTGALRDHWNDGWIDAADDTDE